MKWICKECEYSFDTPHIIQHNDSEGDMEREYCPKCYSSMIKHKTRTVP